MTPEQLAEKILQALTALADDGTITVEGGLPRELKVERPKNPEHGDYATNVAMQLGKRAGLNPRQFAELLAAKLHRRRRDHRGRDRRTGFHQHPGRGRCPGQGRARDRGRRPELRPHRQPARPDGEPGVHLREPDRPAAPRPHPLGRRRRRAGPGARRGRRRGHPRVLHQRPRRPDGQVRRQPAGGRARSADPRGRLPRRVHHRPRQADRRRGPRHHRPAGGTSRSSRSARPGTSASSRSSRPSSSTSGPSSTSGSPSAACTSRTVSATRSRSCASRATCTTPTTRCGCGRPTSPTTRTGC